MIISTQRASNSDWVVLCWVLYKGTVPTLKSLLSKQIWKNPTQYKATMPKKRQEEGNTMHMETEIQKSEMAFHQGWQKQVINSASLGL